MRVALFFIALAISDVAKNDLTSIFSVLTVIFIYCIILDIVEAFK